MTLRQEDQFLRSLVRRITVPTGETTPARRAARRLEKDLRLWAGNDDLADIQPSGSYAKRIVIRTAGGTDIDLFMSFNRNIGQRTEDLYFDLFRFCQRKRLQPRAQNVSIRVTKDDRTIDITPGRLVDQRGNMHTIFRNRQGGRTNTNIRHHISYVSSSGRLNEIKLLKHWRNRNELKISSFALELLVIRALSGNARNGNLASSMAEVFDHLASHILTIRLEDPANSANNLAEGLAARSKSRIRSKARAAEILARRGLWKEVFLIR